MRKEPLPCDSYITLTFLILSTSIFDLVLLDVCHFHQFFQEQLFNFGLYRDALAYILDPCIQEFCFFY